MSGVFRVGTSGWTYEHWRGLFYPPELPQREWFAYYTGVFDTVEVNSSFYHLPRPSTVERWYQLAPPGFLFAVKGSRYITHLKRLQGVEEALNRFFEICSLFREKLGPILFQFPPRMTFQRDVFAAFLELLEKEKHLYAFEFRNPSFFCDEVFEMLQKHNFCLCFADTPRYPYQEVLTASFVYLRLHGSQSLYTHCYSEEELQVWAEKIENWLTERDVYCYFDNDYQGYAISNALRLRELVLGKGE